MRVDNDALWHRIKEGDYLGFSIEGMFNDQDDFTEEEMSTMQEIAKLMHEYEEMNK